MASASCFSEMCNLLNDYRYTNKFVIGVRRALLTHWQKLGLLKDRRDNHETWARYSLAEILWMGIILELRELGLSNMCLVRVCEYVFGSGSDLDSAFSKPVLCAVEVAEKQTRLTFAIIEILQKQTLMLLVVNKAGDAVFKTLDGYRDMLYGGLISNHLIININDCLVSYIKWLYDEPDIGWATGLSRNEVQAILILKGNGFKSFALVKKDGSIGNESTDTTVDLLKKQEYKHLEIALNDNSVFGVARKKRTRTPKRKSLL